MKHNLKITLLLLFSFLSLFTGCQDDAIDLNSKSPDQSHEMNNTIADELLGLVRNPDIKNAVLKNMRNQKSLGDDESQNTYFTKVHIADYDTYTLLVEGYSTATTYYEFFIVTLKNTNHKDNDDEVGFYAQYVPASNDMDATLQFNVSQFVGTLNIFDLNRNLVGSGAIANEAATGSITICNTSMQLTQVKCSHSGEHGVGDTCDPPLINDAHYVQIEVRTDCYTRMQYVGGASTGGSLPSASSIFFSKLNTEDKSFLNNNPEVKSNVAIYLEKTTDSDEDANAFAMELINIARELKEEYGLIGNDELNALRATRETKLNGYFTVPYDSNYYSLINPYLEVDTSNPAVHDPLRFYFNIQCAVIKSQHPEWSMFKVYCRAFLDMVHIGLDLAGLAPGVGEVADLANGIIYTVEGDGTNAALSFAATIPIAGWFSTGAKYALTVNKCILTVRASDNLISFGARESRKFRKLCGLAPGNSAFQAHHLISRAQNILDHPVV